LPRKRRSAQALCAFALLLAVTAGAGASHLRPTANSAGYDDAVGELMSGPDLNRVDVSNDDAGNLTFRVQFANRPTLPDNEGARLLLDVDENPLTGGRPFSGSPGAGYEYVASLGYPQAPRLCTRWRVPPEGGMSGLPPGSLTCSVEPNAAVFRVNRADLDNTTGFNLNAGSYLTEGGNRFVSRDFAPDCVDTWNYRLAGPSTNPNPLCPAAPPPPPPEPPPPPPPPQIKKVYAPDCAGRPRFKPRRIVVACRDTKLSLRRLRWSGWTTKTATGVGVYRWNDCKPVCARGHFHSRAGARVKLDRVDRCRSKGFLQFSRMRVTPPKSLRHFKRFTKKLSCRARSRRHLRLGSRSAELPSVIPN
jgi:hypothetical protein